MFWILNMFSNLNVNFSHLDAYYGLFRTCALPFSQISSEFGKCSMNLAEMSNVLGQYKPVEIGQAGIFLFYILFVTICSIMNFRKNMKTGIC